MPTIVPNPTQHRSLHPQILSDLLGWTFSQPGAGELSQDSIQRIRLLLTQYALGTRGDYLLSLVISLSDSEHNIFINGYHQLQLLLPAAEHHQENL
jgi:hypothetical protein